MPEIFVHSKEKQALTLENKKLLDSTGWQLLAALQQNARLSLAELGRQVGLSAPAVAERLRRMEEAGIITGYQAQINLKAVGLPILAFIRLQISNRQYPELLQNLETWPEVLECHHLAGTDAFMLRVVAGSVTHLESIINRLAGYGQTTTSIVLSSPVPGNIVSRAAAENVP